MTKERKLSINERKLIADFLANIGVAWFTAGVIGPFVTKLNIVDIITSFLWGNIFSAIFLFGGLYFSRGNK